MSAQAKARGIMLAFGIILLVVGLALIVIPSSTFGLDATKLASIGTDQYGVTITMQLYAQSNPTAPLTGPLKCGVDQNAITDYNTLAAQLANPNPACYNLHYFGSPSDPWGVYGLTSTPFQPGTVLKAHGKLVQNSNGMAVPNVQIDVSWYFASPQPSGSFQVFPITSTNTGSDGSFDTQWFLVPTQANNQNIIWFAEVYKGPYSSPTGCSQFSTSSAYCFAQSAHYLMAVGTLPPTQPGLSVWVGQCAENGGTLPAASSTCFQVWQDGQDKYGATPVSVTLPFEVIASSTVGADVPQIFVHAKNLAYGSPIEQSCFPAQMRNIGQTSASKTVYAVNIGSLSDPANCFSKPSSSDTGIPPGKYDVEFTNSATPPWVQSSIIFAIIHVSSGTNPTSWTWPTLSWLQYLGVGFVLVGVISTALGFPRKP